MIVHKTNRGNFVEGGRFALPEVQDQEDDHEGAEHRSGREEDRPDGASGLFVGF